MNDLGPINPTFRCILESVPPPQVLKSQTRTIRGWRIGIPSNQLFITQDGSVYVVMEEKDGKTEFASLKGLIEDVIRERIQIIENFSDDNPA